MSCFAVAPERAANSKLTLAPRHLQREQAIQSDRGQDQAQARRRARPVSTKMNRSVSRDCAAASCSEITLIDSESRIRPGSAARSTGSETAALSLRVRQRKSFRRFDWTEPNNLRHRPNHHADSLRHRADRPRPSSPRPRRPPSSHGRGPSRRPHFTRLPIGPVRARNAGRTPHVTMQTGGASAVSISMNSRPRRSG